MCFLFCSCGTSLKNPLQTKAKFVAPPGPGGIPSGCTPPASFATPGRLHQRPRVDMPRFLQNCTRQFVPRSAPVLMRLQRMAVSVRRRLGRPVVGFHHLRPQAHSSEIINRCGGMANTSSQAIRTNSAALPIPGVTMVRFLIRCHCFSPNQIRCWTLFWPAAFTGSNL